ncbi:MAG: hypothetical protein H7Y17_06860 [Chlorobia bacterium]|nr:hypothetical protein [Fimbriimonadaceae bacterium]
MFHSANPAATVEAKQLLASLYKVKGVCTLSGQHNQMWHMSEVSDKVAEICGHYPLVWGGEWGFSDERNDIDNVKYRPRLLDEIRRHHDAGRIIVMTYHQASPTVGEPCDFQGGVIANLSDSEWLDVLAPTSAMHGVWRDHVSRLAVAFQVLQSESIPIIFRPYHEMNGDWFWWGGDVSCFKALWNQTYELFTNEFGLNNLLWAWNCDRPWPGVEEFYPGHETVDLLGTDIYPLEGRDEVYPQEWYDRMVAIAEGRPIALSEFSVMPTDAQLVSQPWSYFMAWDDLVLRENSDERIKEVFANERVGHTFK